MTSRNAPPPPPRRFRLIGPGAALAARRAARSTPPPATNPPATPTPPPASNPRVILGFTRVPRTTPRRTYRKVLRLGPILLPRKKEGKTTGLFGASWRLLVPLALYALVYWKYENGRLPLSQPGLYTRPIDGMFHGIYLPVNLVRSLFDYPVSIYQTQTGVGYGFLFSLGILLLALSLRSSRPKLKKGETRTTTTP